MGGLGDLDRIDHAEQRPRDSERRHGALAVDQQRRLVTRERDREARRCAFASHRHQARGAQVRPGRLTAQRTVQRLQHPRRVLIAECGGAERVAGQRRHPGCAGTLAAHVANHEHPAVGVVVEDVIEIAAHLVELARRRVQRLHFGARDLRQRFGQQRALKDVGDARALGVDVRAFDRRAGAPSQPHGQAEVRRRQPAHRLDRGERDRPNRRFQGSEQRHDDHRPGADLAHRLQARRRRGGTGAGGLDVAEDARATRADHLRDRAGIVDRRRVSALQLLCLRDLRRVGVMYRQQLELVALVDEVNSAPVGDLRHDQPRDPLQRSA